MKNILVPCIIGIAMLGVLSVVFTPSSKTRRESRAEQNQRLFNVAFETGVISVVGALQEQGRETNIKEMKAQAVAWWNAHRHGESWAYTAASNTVTGANEDFIIFTNVVVPMPTNTTMWVTGPPAITVTDGTNVDYTPLLNALVSDGTFCKVRGHSWGAHMHVTLEYVPKRIACRECQVCGLHQEQYASEWR